MVVICVVERLDIVGLLMVVICLWVSEVMIVVDRLVIVFELIVVMLLVESRLKLVELIIES